MSAVQSKGGACGERKEWAPASYQTKDNVADV
jgi:hypothetical protein